MTRVGEELDYLDHDLDRHHDLDEDHDLSEVCMLLSLLEPQRGYPWYILWYV